jgi:hypothetical protein
MSLKEELKEYKTSPSIAGASSRGRCAVGAWLKQQDPEFIIDFKDILDVDESTMALYRFLADKFDDLPFKLTTFRLHRNRWCSCL